MGTRDELGAADVSDAQLAAMVADLLHEDSVELLDSRVDPVDYDLPAITTGGRWWVSGHATTQCAKAPYRFFVKQVQSWSRSPFFQLVPEHLQEWAASTVPWKTEAEVYRSDIGGLLARGTAGTAVPGRLRPRRHVPSAIWLEVVARPAGDVGPAAVRACGVPPRTVLRQPGSRAARHGLRRHASGHSAPTHRTAAHPGGADAP